MSRVIDRAPLAVSSDGNVLLNVARFDVPKKIEDIVRTALRQRGAVFIGVALSAAEVRRLLDEAAMVLPNVTGPLVGRRQRRTLRRPTSR
jgi:hypothetical protein